ncbi:MAG: YbaB/EbfC family nucleoid-associated protein [Victivallaceae bacterium]|nr:YbaB/EbfC family nucleoid-associated protein [Victivallaceae bacterium]
MFGNLGEMAKMMKQAKDIKNNLKSTQEELAVAEYTGRSSDGAIEVLVSGDMMIKKVVINPDCTGNVAILESLVTAAVNDALTNAKLAAQAKMKELTGGLDIPGLF